MKRSTSVDPRSTRRGQRTAQAAIIGLFLTACTVPTVSSDSAPPSPSSSSPSPSAESTRDSPVSQIVIPQEPRAERSSIAQHGITWTFEGEHPTGQFANGDYWVQGPVTITGMSPDHDGTHHGWEVNPGVGVGKTADKPQAFDARISGATFDAGLLPTLPYRAQPGSSVVKSISADIGNSGCRPCLQTAAVLTVVDAPPPDNGASVFRPPYIGGDKPYYSLRQIRTDLLPSLPAVTPRIPLSETEEKFERVKLDHLAGAPVQYFRPKDNLRNYGGENARETADAALSLMLDDPLDEKTPALVAYIQAGIDWYHMLALGQDWELGGGEDPGHKLPMTFAAALLGDVAMQDAVAASSLFEDEYVRYGNADIALWGNTSYPFGPERNYWNVLVTGEGNRSTADPYGYIDGGEKPGGTYQACCTSQPFKGTALALHLMPALKQVWNPEAFLDYADRWVDSGAWTQPDPCAPAKGSDFEADYGVLYGPDGLGGCIRDSDPTDGVGRFPDLHGASRDGGLQYSDFQNVLWMTHR